MQIQADLVGLSLQRPTMLEATALGAISLAGLGAGIWSDTTALRDAWVQDRAFTPAGNPDALAALREAWATAVAQA
jgi:glycerol kinase